MKLTHFVILIYGILAITAGIIGYFKTDGILYLIICVSLGGVLIFSSNLIGTGNFKGVLLALITSFALGLLFALKYTKYGVTMPSGTMTMVSMIALGFTIFAITNKDQYNK